MARNTDSPPNYRWNFTAFTLDYAIFLLGFGFISPITVIPAFVSQLTNSAPLIGLASSVFNAGWTLPQLATAQLIKDKPRKKRFFYVGAPFRLAMPIIAIALWAGLANQPSAMLTLLFVGMGLFAMSDGFMTLVWFDIMARAIPVNRRGRLIGVAQFMGGVGGIGVGLLVGLILKNWSFAQNYALLFTCASVCIAFSTVATLLIREPPPEEPHDGTVRERRNWFPLLASDRDYRRLMASRLLVGMTALAAPFYVIHATDGLHLPESIIGTFVIATTIGSLISSGVLGFVSERLGSRFIIHVSSAIAVAGPLIVLLIDLAGGGRLTWAYPLAFVAGGVARSAWMLGFTNYTLEMAPPGIRPAYLGMGNTLMGVMAFVPAVGGYLLQGTSYTVLFATATVLTLAGFAFTLTLRPAHVISGEHTAP